MKGRTAVCASAAGSRGPHGVGFHFDRSGSFLQSGPFGSNSRRKQRRANPFQLPEVQKVVAGVQPPHVFEALLAPLAVDPHSDKIRRTQMRPNSHVCPTERGKLLEGVPDVDVAVSEAARPEILIVARQRRPIMRHDHTEPESAHQLGVREMLDHFTNGPFAGRLWPCHDLQGHRVEESVKSGRRLAEDRNGVIVTEQV